jgi:hypothetical protein
MREIYEQCRHHRGNEIERPVPVGYAVPAGQASSDLKNRFLGLIQGSLIKRHKIPKSDGTPYTERDLRVGENACMYGKMFRIVDADPFTRDHLAAQSIEMGPSEGYPADPYQVKLDARSRSHAKGETLRHCIVWGDEQQSHVNRIWIPM